ncbi:MAG TPA: class I SAM-dependent methyltransferase [Patescibacteria group bacterium]|nr:class I SAM-dependent methyltransferase [Patescibacteria group bacterium]
MEPGQPRQQVHPFERRRLTRRILGEAGGIPIGDRRVLEVGSGGGSELAWMVELGAEPSRLVGVDLLKDRVASARSTYPGIDFRHGNAERLDLEDSSVDIVMTLTVFSSIFDERMMANIAAEIVRVLRPGGGLLWYDVRYDSNSNRNVHAMKAKRVRELFAPLHGRLQTVTLLPPLARRLGPVTGAAYPVLVGLPPLRSHLIGLLRKAA